MILENFLNKNLAVNSILSLGLGKFILAPTALFTLRQVYQNSNVNFWQIQNSMKISKTKKYHKRNILRKALSPRSDSCKKLLVYCKPPPPHTKL